MPQVVRDADCDGDGDDEIHDDYLIVGHRDREMMQRREHERESERYREREGKEKEEQQRQQQHITNRRHFNSMSFTKRSGWAIKPPS